MKRAFLIEEIMLEGVSGEVRGTVEIDAQSGLIERITWQSFAFRRDDSDRPSLLSGAQLSAAKDVVHRVLEAESDLNEMTARIVASGDAFSPSPAISQSTRVLAGYLESTGEKKPAASKPRRAQ